MATRSMDSNATAAGRPAPYGRACANCSRAKCKCIMRHTGSGCERCHRLQKECHPSPTVRRRRLRMSPSHTARLERKLDGLVSLLKSTTQASPAIGNSPPNEWEFGVLPTQTDVSRANETVSDQPIEDILCDPAQDPLAVAPLTPHSVSILRPFPYVIPREFEPTPKEAEKYLSIFRMEKLKYFAFIHLPDNISAQQLRQERPFLWLCIMSIIPATVTRQYGLGQVVREVASREILVEGERNLDLLTGLLVFVGWGQYQVHSAPLLTAFTNLCVALVFDLDLHKPILRDPAKMLRCHPKIQVPQSRTMEHRRIFLGCYLLSATIACHQGKMEPLHWSPYLEECWQMLAAELELPSDECFLYQVRLQVLTYDAMSICVRNRESDNIDNLKASELYMKALRSQLQDLKTKMPHHLVDNRIVQLQALCTEITINEIALTRAPLMTTNPETSLEILAGLYVCLQSIKSWFDLFFQYPPSAFIGFSTSVYIQQSCCIFSLYRLTLLNDPVWDSEYVRKTADLSLILEQFIGTMQQVKDSLPCKIDESAGEDVFSKTSRNFGLLKSWWEMRLPTGQGHPIQSTAETIPTADVFPTFEDDDPWLIDILGFRDF